MTTNFMVSGIMSFILLTLVFIGWISFAKQNNLRKDYNIIWFLLVVGGIARLIGASSVHGYPADISCFSSWGITAFEQGIGNFYKYMQDTKAFLDYPPGYMYILYVIGGILKTFNITRGSMYLILLKLPAIIADLGAGFIIYKLARNKFSELVSCAIAFIYIFNPAIFFDSAIWGQVDSVFALFILITLYYLSIDKLILSAVYIAIAMFIKPQAVLFGPIFLWVVIHKLNYDFKNNIKEVVKVILTGLATFLIIALPFTAGFGFRYDWLVELYYKTLSSYPYASVNAFNFFALCGGNWKSIKEPFMFLTYETWSNIFIVLALALSAIIYFKSKHIAQKIFLNAAVINIALFVFASKMHERYMIPAIILLLVGYVLIGDKRILYVYGVFSLASFINLATILGNVLQVPAVFSIPNGNQYMVITAWLNIASLAYLIYICFKPQVVKAEEKPKVNKVEKKPINNVTKNNNDKSNNYELKFENVEKVKIPRIYYVLLALITLVYSVIAFINLGDTKAPQTYWQNQKGNSVVISLQKEVNIDRISFFQGQTTNKYRIELSTDGASYTILNEFDKGSVFQWAYEDINKKASKIRITALKPSTTAFLHEVAVYGKMDRLESSSTPIVEIKDNYSIVLVPIVSVIDKNNIDVKALYDEQNMAVYKPTYLNGSYFDEIYHPRTAYENVHNMEPTETSHPPLGKYLIALGTMFFGMTPFGWRFMGTIFGIMIIPAMFWLAQVIFKNPRYSLIAAALMTLDFMHFTQTRIATIDSFSIFFIIIMYAFMFQYYQLSFYNTDIKKTLKPLFWSGVFFGIGAATKWICIYAGIGLGAIFVISFMKHYNEYNNAKKYGGANAKKVKELFSKNALITALAGVAFFAIIPFCIYILSYFPFTFITGHSYSIGEIFKYQKDMFNYHSQLTATHPYGSEWWSWPFIKRPMWYYSGGTPEKGLISCISAFGNPAIWWFSILAFWASIPIAVANKDKRLILLVIGLFSQYLPWATITRVVFIYHFFASVPFLILLIVFIIYHMEKAMPETRIITYCYLGIVLLLFIMFYPVISGLEVSKGYVANWLSWSKDWVFFIK